MSEWSLKKAVAGGAAVHTDPPVESFDPSYLGPNQYLEVETYHSCFYFKKVPGGFEAVRKGTEIKGFPYLIRLVEPIRVGDPILSSGFTSSPVKDIRVVTLLDDV